MLPSSLLIARKWRDKIRPVHAKLNPKDLGAARLLIKTYIDYVGRTKGELHEAVDGIEQDLGYDYRYIRGLSALLDRRCQLEAKATINPVRVRRKVFKAAHRRGFPTSTEDRQVILRQAAGELRVTVEELEESFYGDLKNELVLKDFTAVDHEALVKQYNLSLTQTLLFYSTELTFTTTGNWQRIFTQIKWLGLIYTIRRRDNGYEVKVDGPASLFKLNRRYGTSLAKLLPLIVQNREWKVTAKILRRKGERRLLNLELDSDKHGGIMKALGTAEETEVYDSQVEQDFAYRFKALHTGWTVTREPEPIPVGNGVMIPDFALQKGGLKVYLEVMGFWTPRYLQEKVRKLTGLGEVDMIVAANENLACRKLDKIGAKLNVIYYKRKIPLKPILLHLKVREERLVKEQTLRLNVETLPILEPIDEAKDIAERMGVLEEAVKAVLREHEVQGYTRLGDMLIKNTKLEEIREAVESRLNQGDLSLEEASRIVEEIGGRRTVSILDALGYKIEWHGIDPNSASIQRKRSV